MLKRIFNLADSQSQPNKQNSPFNNKRKKHNLSDQIKPELTQLSDPNKTKDLEIKIQDLEIELRNQEFSYYVKLKTLEEKYQKEIQGLQNQIKHLKKINSRNLLQRSLSRSKLFEVQQNERKTSSERYYSQEEEINVEIQSNIQTVDSRDLTDNSQLLVKEINQNKIAQQREKNDIQNLQDSKDIYSSDYEDKTEQKYLLSQIHNISSQLQKFNNIIEKFSIDNDIIKKQLGCQENQNFQSEDNKNDKESEKDIIILKLNEQLKQKDLKISKHKNFILEIKQQLVKVMQEKSH